MAIPAPAHPDVIRAELKDSQCDSAVFAAAATGFKPSHTPVESKWSNGHSASFDYKILEQPSRVNRHLKVITIGAGASALNFAHEISTSKLDVDLVCYEKNPEIGGTWFENKYPGCACDIPSVNYQFSWAPGVWSS